MNGSKQLALVVKSAGAPDEAQLAAIRAYTLADIPADELYVRTFVVAHNAIDRDKEAFAEALLHDFARTLPGKGLHIRHPSGYDGDSGPGEGRWFAAWLERMPVDEARKLLREPSLSWPPDVTEAVLLMGSAYMVRTAENASLLKKLDGGVAGDVSIGFSAKGYNRLRDAEGRELNAYRWEGPGEAHEASLVWLGAQPGARAVKSATKETAVDLEKKLVDVEAENAKLKGLADTHAKAAAQLEAVKSALGDEGALLDEPAQLVALVKAGKSHREDLVERIVKHERQIGIVGDDDTAVSAAKALRAGEPIDRLQALAKHYEAAAEKGDHITGGDPNPNRAASKATGIFANPVITGANRAAN